jgi:hypothetical protein
VQNYDIQSDSVYSIINNAGNTVARGAMDERNPIDITQLPSGMYILMLQDQTRKASTKFFKR